VPPTTTLDPTGHAIISALARDGRASYQAIADEVGLSRPAVMDRVKRLEDQGVISGYTAVLDRGAIGRPITAFINVRYPTSSHVGTEPWIQALREHPDVLECHHVAGDDCYILKVAVAAVEDLQNVLRALRPAGESANTRTTIVLQTIFEKAGVLPAEIAEVVRG
jgi:Lrp/AsnC family transcriptional regulator, leucine-responsive regulatory protein